MRELLRLAKLLDQSKDAKSPDEVRLALIALVQYLYDKEYDRERQEKR
jgi:hypothetical protein